MGIYGIVKRLLDTGKIDVSVKDYDGWMALSRAEENGHGDIVKLLEGFIATERSRAETPQLALVPDSSI